MMTDAVQVFLFALPTALATGLGVAPLVFARHPTRQWLGASNALAAGLMLAASFGLVYEGVAHGLWRTLLGVLLGLAFIVLTRSIVQKGDIHAGFEQMGEAGARKALLIVAVMTLHSFTEGVAIGVSFGGDRAFGVFIALALAVHNIPEGLAIGLVLVPRGVGAGRAHSVQGHSGRRRSSGSPHGLRWEAAPQEEKVARRGRWSRDMVKPVSLKSQRSQHGRTL